MRVNYTVTLLLTGRASQKEIDEAVIDSIPKVIGSSTGASVVEDWELTYGRIPLYRCINCDHIYQEKVTQCDCMPDVQEYEEGYAYFTDLRNEPTDR